MSRTRSPRYIFGPFHLQPDSGSLFRATEELKLRPKSFEVLCLLVQNPGKLFTHDAILDTVWKGVHVGADVVLKSISEIRQVLDDRTKPPRYIETLYRRGFRFIPSVQVTGESSTTTTTRAPLLGRQFELAVIDRAVQAAFDDSRGAVFLSGPAGVGKTRILQEVADSAVADGVYVLRARADNAARHSAYWIWTQILHDFAQRTSPADFADSLGGAAADILLVVPSLHNQLHDVAVPTVLEPEMAHVRFFDGLIQFLATLTRRRPLLLAIDDLHKEGSSSITLLHRMLNSSLIKRLLVVATYRHGEEANHPALKDLIESCQRENLLTEIKVDGLPRQHIEELIDSHCSRPLNPELRERIVHDSGGNPYFALEILKWFRDHRGDDDSKAGKNYRIPRTVHRVVDERIQQLDPNTHSLLRVGALMGPSFNARTAARVAGLTSREMFAAIGQTLRAELLTESPESPDELSFRHDLVRETLLEGLPRIETADLHFRIGEALEALNDQETLLPRLAYHFAEAGSEKALAYSLQAGKRAAQNYSNIEAIQTLQRALTIAERHQQSPGELTFEILEQLAEVYANIDQYDEADACADRMHKLAATRGNPTWLARAAIAMSARCYMPQRMQRGAECIDALEQALETLPAEEFKLYGILSGRTALALMAKHDGEARRLELAKLTVEIARRQPNLTERGYLLRDAVMAYWDADHVQERMALSDELIACARTSRNLYLQGEAIAWHALGLLATGQFNECDRYARAVEPTILAMRAPAALLYLRRVQMLLHLVRGRLDDAQNCLTEYRQLKQESAAFLNAAEPLETISLQLALERERGLSPDTLGMLGQFAAMFPHMPLRQVLPYFLAQAGLREQAREAFDSVAANDLADLPIRNEAHCWLAGTILVGDACAELADTRHAESLYSLLQPYEDQWALAYYAASMLGSAGRVLGRLAALLGKDEDAARHFAKIASTCEREGVITELIRSKLDYASILATRSHPDTGAAKHLMEDSIELASRHELPALLSRAEAALAQLHHRSPSKARVPLRDAPKGAMSR